MIGYKIAVGVTKVAGFFPVLVTLEIPDSAKVITPVDGVACRDQKNRGFEIKKYRTNKCTVKDISEFHLDTFNNGEPLIPDITGWDHVAYSLYEILLHFKYRYYGIHAIMSRINMTRYTKGAIISVDNLDERVENDCGKGIHFFKSIEDVRNYYSSDSAEWFRGNIYRMDSLLSETPDPFGQKGNICAKYIFDELTRDDEE